jgi:hypothetical protein
VGAKEGLYGRHFNLKRGWLSLYLAVRFQAIRQDQIGHGFAVAFKLLGVLRLVQRLTDIFGLHVTDREAIPS